MSRCDAVQAMYQDMAARHRSRFRSIHVSNFWVPDTRNDANDKCRFSRSLRLRRLTTSVAHTSSSSSPRTSSSLFLTVSPRARPRRSLPPRGHRLSTRCLLCGDEKGWGWSGGGSHAGKGRAWSASFSDIPWSLDQNEKHSDLQHFRSSGILLQFCLVHICF